VAAATALPFASSSDSARVLEPALGLAGLGGQDRSRGVALDHPLGTGRLSGSLPRL
jgi:hypothetical protein